MSGLVLRSYFRSSCSWRVRIALRWKGLAHDYVPVHLLRDEQHAEDHRAVNPMEQLPVLLVDGVPVSQSLAILEYLEEAHPEPALLPREPLARARARQLAEIVNSGIQPLQNLGVMRKLGRDFGADKDAQVRWCRDWILKGLGALERLTAEGGGACCVGDAPTIADCCLVPQLYNARRFGVDVAAFPALARIEAGLLAIEAFAETHPDKMPDAE